MYNRGERQQESEVSDKMAREICGLTKGSRSMQLTDRVADGNTFCLAYIEKYKRAT